MISDKTPSRPHPFSKKAMDKALSELHSHKQEWVDLSIEKRIDIVVDVKKGFLNVMERWAEWSVKVYEVDPLICPSCGGQMSVISFIEEPKVIDRVIRHLELTFEAERPPPPHHVQQELLMAAEKIGLAEPNEIGMIWRF